MGMIAASCPKCGANLEVPEGKEGFYCKYCGAKIIKNVDYIEVSGEVSVKGIADEDSLLQRAYIFIEDGNFKRALKYINNVLDIEPDNAKAYIGMFLCQIGVRTIEAASTRNINPYDYGSYKKAIKYSSGTERKKYLAINSKIKANITRRKRDCQNQLREISEKLSMQTAYYEEFKKEQDMKNNRRNLWLALMVFAILNFLFWLLVTLDHLIFLIFSIPSTALLIWVIIKYCQTEGSNQYELNRLRDELLATKNLLYRKQLEYQQFEIDTL